MPKARSALLSAVSGSLKDSLTFRNNPQTDAITMQTRPVPTGAPTAKQTAVREAYARLAYLWKNLSHLDKEPYQIMAEARALTPWNCWLSFHLPLMRLTPLFYTAFAEGTGTVLQNFAVGGTTGDLNGPVWQEKNQYPNLYFDGVDDRALFTQLNHYDTNPDFSIFAVISNHITTGFVQYIGTTKTLYGSTSGIGLYLTGTKQVGLSTGTGAAAVNTSSTLTIPDNQVSVIGVIKIGTAITFYLNGTTQSKTASAAAVAPSNRGLMLGNGNSTGNPFKGTQNIFSILPGSVGLASFAALDAHYLPFFT